MPKYYCDYCDVFLTHDAPSVRRDHNTGWKHQAAIRTYFQTVCNQDKMARSVGEIIKEYEERREFVPIPVPVAEVPSKGRSMSSQAMPPGFPSLPPLLRPGMPLPPTMMPPPFVLAPGQPPPGMFGHPGPFPALPGMLPGQIPPQFIPGFMPPPPHMMMQQPGPGTFIPPQSMPSKRPQM